jgi:methylated-DNA-protein-cysteine methyltransferase-like protein
MFAYPGPADNVGVEPSFETAVIEAIRALKPGEVASYGEIAEEAGFPRAARAVGTLLSRTSGLPWWRVVRADGRLASGKPEQQRRRLEKEGVRVVGGRVVGSR